MTTLAQALALAESHWGNRAGARTMSIMAKRAGDALGLPGTTDVGSLTSAHGVELLAALRASGVSKKYVQSCYGAFRRALTLSGIDTPTWPSAPTPPRKVRDRMSEADIDAMIAFMKDSSIPSMGATGDLVVLLRGTGARVSIEALSEARFEVTMGDTYDTLKITGKGDHERWVPVVDLACRTLMRNGDRMKRLRSVPYGTHGDNFRRTIKALGITSKRAGAHAIRHAYASEALDKSGGNIAMVQELLGHADPATTARYLHVDLAMKAKALGSGGH